MKQWKVIPILCLGLVMSACLHKRSTGTPGTSLEQTARDTSAALNGTLKAAQSQHEAECVADKTQATCALISRAVSGHNALITAIQTYCGWKADSPPVEGENTPCVPVTGTEGALQSAIANAQQLTGELKGVVKP